MVCPFFGQNETTCEIGSGYISPHDAQIMSTYCCCHHEECLKFRELAERYPDSARYGYRQAESKAQAKAPAPSASAYAPITIKFRNKWPLTFRMQYLNSNFNHMFVNHEEERMNKPNLTKKGWTVALAGTGINLALGILYTWSIFKGAIGDSISRGGEGAFDWNPASINDPYAIACLAFAVAMILAGKLQDKFGPKITCILGGLLVGGGFVWISQTTDYWSWIVGFGVMAGLGIGFGYSAATPPALKWFPPAKTGLIAGIVVAGFGIAPVYLAPLSKYLLGSYGLHSTMMILGIAFIAIVCGMALLISNPPADFVPDGGGATVAKKSAAPDKTPMEILREGRFYTLWTTYFIGAGAGLMVIGSIAGLAKKSMGEMAFLAVVMMSIGNAGGRVVAGVLSDKIGRGNTLMIMLVFQAALMFAAIPVVGGSGANAVLVTLLASFIGFNYGTNLSLFPSFAKDYWGSKNYGMNYGILFSAWGVGAFVLVKVSSALSAKFGGFTVPLAVAGVMLLVGAMLSLSLRRPKLAGVEQEALAPAEFEEEDLAFQSAAE